MEMKHTFYKCKCNQAYCQFCDGGLAHCTVCNGFEGTLPTECPGKKMTEQQEDDVWKADLDFRNGEWCKKKEPIR